MAHGLRNHNFATVCHRVMRFSAKCFHRNFTASGKHREYLIAVFKH